MYLPKCSVYCVSLAPQFIHLGTIVQIGSTFLKVNSFFFKDMIVKYLHGIIGTEGLNHASHDKIKTKPHKCMKEQHLHVS